MSDTTSSSHSRMGSTPGPSTLTGTGLSPSTRINGVVNAPGGISYNFIPNIPQPVNGMIKTYDTTHRSFTRPYSAKTVFFYKEGDHYFTGVRVPISKSRYRNMDSLLDDLNSNIPLPFGVRRLHTPFGKTPIESIDQLQHLGKYVASSSKIGGKSVDIDAVEKHQQKMREIAQRRWERFNEQQSISARLPSDRWKSRTYGLFLPMTAKQLFFILNGNPGRVHRVIINPYRKFDFDICLEEVSQGLGIAIWKLYAFTGERIQTLDELLELKENRVLAVPRHERPIFPTGISKESSSSSVSSAVTLPPINRVNLFHHQIRQPQLGRTTTHYAMKLPQRPAAIRKNHSIERSPIARDSRVPAAAMAPPRRTFNYHRTEPRSFVPQMASTSRTRVAPVVQPLARGAQNRRVMSLKPRRNPPGQANRVGLPATTLLATTSTTSHRSSTASASVEENDSDSGRPRSTDFEEATEEQSSESDALDYEEDEDSDDYPDVHPGMISEHDSLESPPPSRVSNVSRTPPSTSAQTPASTRPHSGVSHPSVHFDDDDHRHAAAVTIQKHVRGHLTRKNMRQKPRPDTPMVPPSDLVTVADEDGDESSDSEEEEGEGDHPAKQEYDDDYSEPEQSEHSDVSARAEDESESEPEQDEEFDTPREKYSEERRHEAATTIQKNWRGYNVRRKMDKRGVVAMPAEEEGFEESFEDEEVRLESEMAPVDGQPSELDADIGFTYTAAIMTGNRWAADTESDLYIILYGDEGQSEKHFLRQDFINWLQTDSPKFKQGKTDEFVLACQNLGRLRKITIGHEHPGYGGGVFIDQIIITENNPEEPKRYLFQCYKWLDSGQVDGKLERTLNCTALYHMGSANADKSKGRWELLIHNGNDEGKGGTTSNLNIFGYGVNGMSRSVDIYDSTLANVPSVSLIQVDFGEEIGDLIKMRIEIDGNGSSPDYFLNHVEMRDIDTDERIEINVNSWLKWESKERGAQAFRELIVFRGLANTLPLYTYEGKMRIIPSKVSLCSPSIKLELCGDQGESGIFPASIVNKEEKTDKFDVSFKVEAVSVGRILAMRVYFDPTLEGEIIFEGLAEMQKILDKMGLEDPLASDFLISYVIVRESFHAPYRTVLGHSRIQPRRDNIPDDSYVKELRMTSMEGLSTKLPKKKALKRKTPTWVVSMILDDDSTLLPEVTMCGDKKNEKMKCLDQTPTDNIIGYQLKDAEIGELRKIRVTIDRSQRLNYVPEKEIDTTNNKVFIKKIRVVDAVNGDELRFPVANIEMSEYSVYEFPAIWPDVPPLSNVNYELTVSTGESKYSEPFYAHINIHGEFGDTGFRYIGEENPVKPTEFHHDSQNVFQMEAVSLGELTSIDVHIDETVDDFIWECQEMVIPDPLTDGVFYAFRFDEPFTSKLLTQSATVSPLTAAL